MPPDRSPGGKLPIMSHNAPGRRGHETGAEASSGAAYLTAKLARKGRPFPEPINQSPIRGLDLKGAV
jgi:hypothetical protein